MLLPKHNAYNNNYIINIAYTIFTRKHFTVEFRRGNCIKSNVGVMKREKVCTLVKMTN